MTWERYEVSERRVRSFPNDTSYAVENDLNHCQRPSGNDLKSSCPGKAREYPVTSEDLAQLKKNDVFVTTYPCPSNVSSTCLSIDRQAIIGAGTFGLVVRGRSKLVHFPLAVKFIRLPAKLDLVSFNTQGRYHRIDRDSLALNHGSETSLREAVALRLLTEYEIPAVPKYVAYIETSSYRILAMEYLDGYEELSTIIDQLSAKELLAVSCQAAAIVCNLDRIGVAHDDMHERNILIDRKKSNRVALIDFGGAQFSGQHGHFTSASNFLKQPINLLGHVKRLVRDDLLDNIQSQEKQEMGRFCSQLDKLAASKNERDKETIPYHYQVLTDKYWPITQIKKNLFKCTLSK